MNILKRSICMLLLLAMVTTNTFASEQIDMEAVLEDTAEYIYETVKTPQVGSIGGEWAVLGLARSGMEIPEEYYQNYYEEVESYVKERQGNLHQKKFTEYSRLIVTLTAIGKDPAYVAGYNLLTPLGDFEKTIWQGMNGPIWALIALDSGNYEMPENPGANVQATRELYLNRILDCQLADGGWSLFGGTKAEASGDGISDPDITGMALQALSKYQDDERVQIAIEKALTVMSERQDEKGGYSSWGTSNSESCVQILVALCELGIPYNDNRFVKNGYTILDNLLTFYQEGNGFRHTQDGNGSNLMATEQAFYGLVALKRMQDGKPSLYTMTDPISISQKQAESVGLAEKHPDVKKMDVQFHGKTFSDILGHPEQAAIETLSACGIINGKTEASFEPQSTMTRAEFATIIARGLGLPQKEISVFSDVAETDWFYPYVNTAYTYGIIKGVSETEFYPNGTITREEAAVMVARAASLCGMDTDIELYETRNVLSQFSDYVTAATWSQSSLAFCYQAGILSDGVLDIQPKQAVTRAEIAVMLHQMLSLAKLI